MSSKFRFLNEQLYTTASNEAVELFKEKELFENYHEGYRQQVQKWPKNPLDLITTELKKAKYRHSVIADFGCGEGKLQLNLEASGHKGKICSFDVGKTDDHVIQADIASVPLADHSTDVGVFSLSLMGTNFPEFLIESNRVLKMGGILIVAEVMSRFKDINEFILHMKKQAGFKALKVTKLKDFFYLMIFEKVKERKFFEWDEDFVLQLKPCLYKRR